MTAHTFTGCQDFRMLRRRAVLQAGGLGLLSQMLGQRVATAEVDEPLEPRTARACIFLFMWGGPSQLETFDPKPDAPAEIRGPFQPIETNVPGIRFSEHFPMVARRADQLAVIRSLTHDDPSHLASAHCTLTGQLAPVVKSDAVPPSDRDTPHLGSLISHLYPAAVGTPSFVTIPWMAYHPAAPGGKAPGQNGGWLGHHVDPLLVTGDPAAANWSVPALTLQDGLSLQRLDDRRRLLSNLDEQRHLVDQFRQVRDLTGHQQRAFSMLTSPRIREAFDLGREPDAIRDAYGRNTHGQSVLLARRLVEFGVPFVSVNWHNDGRNFWDTHGNNFNRIKDDLAPPSDRALATLLDDLKQRGLLDTTLVCWVGEFGRRPQITQGNAGREHWPWCYNGLFAGGGIQGGQVYGSSDKQAAYPADSPVSPQQYAATILQAFGIPREMAIRDPETRPRRLYGGEPLSGLFG